MTDSTRIQLTMSRGEIHEYETDGEPSIAGNQIRTGFHGDWLMLKGGRRIRISDIVEMSH